MRILVAGVGNLLQGDDGFGVEVAHRLQALSLPPEVTVVETGTGGIHLVQEITAGFDALIVIDAVDRGRPPGTVMVIDPEIDSADGMTQMERFDYLADMHYTKPAKALMLARALNVLPERSVLVGCQPRYMDRLVKGLSEPVAAAVDTAVAEIEALIADMLSGNGSGG
ncbi:MAG: hydrogenase maturation protease [Actinomycetota bacterium]